MSAAACAVVAALSVWECALAPAPAATGALARTELRFPEQNPTVEAKVGGDGRVTLREENISWDFVHGAYSAKIALDGNFAKGSNGGDLYMNRDSDHSRLVATNWPGLVEIRADENLRTHAFGRGMPDVLFNRPVFGNASLAFTQGPFWRSFPRALTTIERRRLPLMQKMYLSNQIWVFPAVDDFNFVNTNLYGDVFASVTPYWISTEGRSWSDQYYLKAALEASRSFKPETKKEIVRRGLLAPTVQSLLRKSLKKVSGEEGYLSPAAHPTAMPPNALDMRRLKEAAAAMEPDGIPPVVAVSIIGRKPSSEPPAPEVMYVTPFASSFVLRAPDEERSFTLVASGADEYAFRIVHDDFGAARIENAEGCVARVLVRRSRMTSVNRVDVAVFGKTRSSGWGAPSFVSFAVVEPVVKYSDPAIAR